MVVLRTRGVWENAAVARLGAPNEAPGAESVSVTVRRHCSGYGAVGNTETVALRREQL